MARHTKKVLFITTGVITLAVVAGILALLLKIKAFKPQIEAAASSPKSSEFISVALPKSSQQSPSEVGARRFHPYRALSEQK